MNEFQSRFMRNSIKNIDEYLLTDSLKISAYNNSTVFPLIKDPKTNLLTGGIKKTDNNYSELAKTYRISPENFNLKFEDLFINPNPDPTEEFNELHFDSDVVFIGALPLHYGHFITEGLSRLWPLLYEEYQNLKIIYISEHEDNPFEEFFELFGIDLNDIHRITAPTKYRKIYVPQQSIRLHDYCHEDYGNTISKILENVDTKSTKKIFLSKKNNRFNGKSIGESNIEKIFKKNNFEIIYPETLGIKEFLSIMISADKVAALSASSAHNAIFMKKNSKLICLNRSKHIHPLQTMINYFRSLNVIYVDTHLNFFKPNFSNGPYNIIISKQLRRFLNESNYYYPNYFYSVYKLIISSIIYSVFFLFLGKTLKLLSKLKNRTKM